MWNVFIVTLLVELCASSKLLINSDQWDYYVFSQHWPLTTCEQWKEKSDGHDCTLPTSDTLWTVHGLWPSLTGKKEGPEFCNKSLHFNKTTLSPILTNLEEYWMNIEANTPLYDFWEHEWTKHGTCAVNESSPIKDELDFFNATLHLAHTYKVGDVLLESGIKPQSIGYLMEDIFNAIEKKFNVNVMIECVIQKHTKLMLLSEIRLCLDKQLNLINCDQVKHQLSDSPFITNCDMDRVVSYIDKIPQFSKQWNEISYYNEFLFKFYQLVQFLMKFTV